MKTAICLVVKDEESEIAYWIAWHKALGFDSFIIYNDFSDDNTESVILSLMDSIDIRYARNAVNRDLHNIRQVRAYNDAVTRYGSEFDWIAFFDADEYLDLDGQDIGTYLQGVGDASLVAFNWSCVGPNGFVSRPAGAPVLNYTRHGTPDLYWNRHTKVIFRPSRLIGEISQVHNVYVSGDSVDAAGRPIVWASKFGGFTESAPDWQGGKLVHYQSRSLEHYVKRDRHLEEVRRDAGDPLHTVVNKSEYNAVETSFAESYISGFLVWMQRIASQQAEVIARVIRGTPSAFLLQFAGMMGAPDVPVFRPSYRPLEHEIRSNWISFHESSGGILKSALQDGDQWIGFYLDDHFGRRLGALQGKLSVDDSAEGLIGIFSRGSRYVHLFTADGTPWQIKGDPRITQGLTFEAWQNSDGTVSLSHPRTNRYLGFLPNGTYSAHKIRALAWESFTLRTLTQAECPAFIKGAASYLSGISNLEDFRRGCEKLDRSTAPLLFNAYATLDEASRKSVALLVKGILGEHLF